MLAVLRSHRLPRSLCGAIAVCLVLIAPGCGGGGYGGSNTGGNYNPMPAISSLAPTSASPGAAAQTLTINGSGFMAASTVTYNGAAHTVSYVSASQLSIQLSAADQATAGSYAVVVTNPAPGGGTSNSVNFMVTAANPTPAITGLSPPSATAGSAAQTLTINGSGFMATSTVSYNGVAHTATFASATQLTIQLTAADQAMVGSYAVIVTNAPPGGGASASATFTVGNPVPMISGLSPASATAGAMAQTLTINGSGFMSSSSVTYNGAVRTATFVSASQLTLQLSTADQATVGNYPVIVTNPIPGGGASNTATFTVAPAIPSGATVLVVGGQAVASMPLTSAEVYASAAFTTAGNMLVARYRPTASLISSGATILIAGGLDASGGALKTAETYQIAGKTFGTATIGMQCAHKGHTATVLTNGKVLIAGRDGTTTTACAELYDPGTGTFTRTGDMATPLSDHAAVLLANGKVLIVGGSVDASGCVSCTATKSAELYDPNTGIFTATSHSLLSARSSPTATLLSSGKVLITGGGVTPTSGPLRNAELYDPVADTFTSITSNMSVERQFHTATLLTSGQVLLAGGLTKVGSVATASADLYDPATNAFKATSAMASARLYHTATPLGNGVILIVGGIMQPTGMGESGAELYDPTTGVFTMTGGLTTGRYGAAASPLQ
jgi:hypothetical protein